MFFIFGPSLYGVGFCASPIKKHLYSFYNLQLTYIGYKFEILSYFVFVFDKHMQTNEGLCVSNEQ